MAVPETKQPAPRTLVWVVVAIVVLLGAYVWRERATAVVAEVPVVAGVVPTAPGAAAPAADDRAGVRAAEGGGAGDRAVPRFDVVRVGPQGGVVVAGRAAPGADVVVWDSGVEIARTQADPQGSFVALPAAPLAAGGQELTLTARGAAGVEVKGDGPVLVNVPEQGVPSGAAATAVLVPRDAAPVVLQGAGGEPVGRAAAPAGPTLDRVEYDDAGAIQFSGGVAAGSTVRVYVDNAAVGDAVADAAGRWALTPAGPVAPGVHQLRVDQTRVDGTVVARVELPFQRAAVPVPAAASGPEKGGTAQVVVQPGQTLWRLARAAYGQGVRYTVIFLANREQIRDAKLIYPGQTFAVPSP